MKKIILLTLFLALLVACESQTETQGKQIVKIGASLPLSGDVAFLGDTARNALELALEDVNSKSTKYQYQLIFEDDKIDATQAATAATKLIQVDNVDALVSLSSGTGNAISPITQASKVIHFGIASDPNVAKGEFNFIHWTPPSEEARVWIAEAQKRGIKNVGILELQHAGVKAVTDALKAQGSGKLTFTSEIIQGGEKDFRTHILKVKQTNPDIYLLMAFSPELDILHKQMKEEGITTPLSSIEAFELSNDPAQFEGQWYVNAADANGDFNARYQAKFGKGPQTGTQNAYDILNLIVEGYERAGSSPAQKPTHEEVVAQLMQIKDFDGVLGTLSVGDEGMVWSKAAVRTIQNGKPVTIG
ncbi:MAG TPA: ABC transporter substrate-binding protein [Candidatus Nanoarchaeia archaeon]|nr:ABC transporter substrate-binding protein [Candidatus Nanoarchaeia archaeon]